jgi:uncharacterized protein
MLSFDIRALESNAALVHGDLSADDPVWIEGDARPQGAVHIEGRISAAGESRFYFSGSISGALTLDCRRCLVDVVVDVTEEAHFLLAPLGDETTADDPDVFTYDPGAHNLDLRPAVREFWLLSAPALVQCKPECKGLCPQCGTDLNTETCPCVPETPDSRWDTLRKSQEPDTPQRDSSRA